jgi:ParB family chromosome partitioning protein
MENKGNFRLVAGGHRFEAAKRLGLETIRCTVLEADDLRVELAEIDENLQRNDPGPAEHALLTGRRTEIIRQLALQNGTLSQTATASRQSQRRAGEETGSDPGSVRDHAIKTGETKDTVQRSKKRFETLGSAVLKKVVGTSLDKGAQLDALAQLPEAEREDLVNRASGGETVSARQVLRESKREAEEEPEPQSAMASYRSR